MILTVAKYESPLGKAFESEGITPDVQVASNLEDRNPPEDEGPTSTTHPAPAPAPKHSAVQPDDQLNKALEILKAKAA